MSNLPVSLVKDSADYYSSMLAIENDRWDEDQALTINYGRVELNFYESVPNGGSALISSHYGII